MQGNLIFIVFFASLLD